EGKIDSTVQTAIWDRLLNLPASFFRQYKAGDLVERAMGIHHMKWILSDAVTLSLLAGVFSVFSFALLFYDDVSLALVATVMMLASMLVTVLFGRIQLRYQREIALLEGENASLSLQLLNAVAKLRAAGAEQRAFGVWADSFARQKL